jgi:hypothetical protein
MATMFSFFDIQPIFLWNVKKIMFLWKDAFAIQIGIKQTKHDL